MPDSEHYNAPPWAAAIMEAVRGVREKQEELCEKHDRLDKFITGGDSPERGLLMQQNNTALAMRGLEKKVEGMESDNRERRNLVLGALASGLVAMVLAAWAKLTGGPSPGV